MNDVLIQHPQQLSPVIRALRRRARLSQRDVAERLGISHQAVSMLEKSPEKATLERLLRLLQVLQVDLVMRPAGRDVPAAAEW